MITTRHQEKLFAMLGKISSFFDDHGIRYYLLGGSCIGALRHRGFIPWDDDVDLMVDRDSYYRLLGCMDEWPWEDIEFSCFERDEHWYRAFAQFSSTDDTEYQRSLVFNRGLSLGTKIDLMIIDYVPSAHMGEYLKDFLIYQEADNFVFMYRPEIGDYADEFEAVKRRQEEIGRKATVEGLKSKLERYSPEESDKRVVRFLRRGGKRLRDFDASWMGEPQYREFEGLSLPVPARPEACLRYQYGFDWYLLPSAGAYHQHNYFSNPDVPGIEYHEHLSRSLDFDGLEELCELRKRAKVQRARCDNRLVGIWNDLAVQLLLMDLDLDAVRSSFERGGSGRDEELAAAMQPVLAARKKFAGVDAAHRGIPDDLLDDWVAALIRCGRYYDAEKAASAFRDGFEPPTTADELVGADGKAAFPPPSAEVFGAGGLLERVLLLAAAYQDRDLDALSALVSRFTPEETREVPDVVLALKRLKESGCAIGPSWEDLMGLCDGQLAEHPRNYDIMKAKGDLLMRAGAPDEAMALYAVVHANTRNGLDLLELEAERGFSPRYTEETLEAPSGSPAAEMEET